MATTKRRPLGARTTEIRERLGVSLRTISRWRRQPPHPIPVLLRTPAGRELLRQWIEQADQADQADQQVAA